MIGESVDKKDVVNQVSIKIRINQTKKYIDSNKNSPLNLYSYFDKNIKGKYNLESVKTILSAIENDGYINKHNISVWKKVYGNLGVVYPISEKT